MAPGGLSLPRPGRRRNPHQPLRRAPARVHGARDRGRVLRLITNLAALVLQPRLAVNAYFTPLIARIYARGDFADLRAIVAWSSFWSALGAVFGRRRGLAREPGSSRVVRAYLPDGRTALGILIVGQVIATSAGAQLQLLKMTGREIAAAEVLAASLAVTSSSEFSSCPAGGCSVPRGGECCRSPGWNGLMVPIVWRHLGIRPFPLPRRSAAAR